MGHCLSSFISRTGPYRLPLNNQGVSTCSLQYIFSKNSEGLHITDGARNAGEYSTGNVHVLTPPPHSSWCGPCSSFPGLCCLLAGCTTSTPTSQKKVPYFKCSWSAGPTGLLQGYLLGLNRGVTSDI